MTREEKRRVKVIMAMLEPILLSERVQTAFLVNNGAWLSANGEAKEASVAFSAKEIASSIYEEAKERWTKSVVDLAYSKGFGKEEQ